MSDNKDSKQGSIDETTSPPTVTEPEQPEVEVETAQAKSHTEAQPEPVIVDVPVTESPQPKKGGNGVAYLALLLSLVSLCALGAGFWLWQKVDSEQRQLQTAQQLSLEQWQAQQNGQFQALEQSLKQQIEQQQQQLLAEQSQTQQAVTDELRNSVNGKLSSMQERIAEVSGRAPNDWVLAEAEYLVRMAGRKLWVEQDKNTAKSLLSHALLRVKSLSDPSLESLEQALVNDIAMIEGLYEPKTYDYYRQLAGIIAQVDHYPINTVETIKEQLPSETALQEEKAEPSWWDNVVNNLSPLKKMIYVNPGVADADIQRVLMPEQQWFLRTNVKMALMHAQLALLQHNEATFRDSLQQAKVGLGKFNQTHTAVIAGIKSLEEGFKEPVNAVYPETLPSHLILNRILRLRLGKAAQGIAAPAEIVPVPTSEAVVEGER